MSYDFKIQNGDWHIGQDGDIQKVLNTEKLVQDLLKVSITPLGSNIFFKWYGSPISKTLIGNVLDIEFVTSTASDQLNNSIQMLQNLQREQAKRQRVSPFEQIAAIRNIIIERNQVDPRYFYVAINVLTNALSEASASFNVNTVHGL